MPHVNRGGLGGRPLPGDRIDIGHGPVALLARPHEYFFQLLRFRIVDLDNFGSERLKFFHHLTGFQFLLLLLIQLIQGRNPDDIAILALTQTLGLQHQIQCLIPGNILEPERDVTVNGVTGYYIDIGEVGQDLQNGSHRNVLEVQRQLVA